MDNMDVMIWNFFFGSGRWGVTNFIVVHRREGLRVTALTRWYISVVERTFSHKLLVTLLQAPKMLKAVAPSKFRGSPLYEFPTRPNTIFYRILIWYDGLVAIILEIFLSSFSLAHESVMHVTSRKWGEYAYWVRNINLCLGSITIRERVKVAI